MIVSKGINQTETKMTFSRSNIKLLRIFTSDVCLPDRRQTLCERLHLHAYRKLPVMHQLLRVRDVLWGTPVRQPSVSRYGTWMEWRPQEMWFPTVLDLPQGTFICPSLLTRLHLEVMDLRLDLKCQFVTCQQVWWLETFAKRDHVVAISCSEYNDYYVLVMIG